MYKNYDVLVIGGGPAGCAVASYVARCRWKALVVDRSIVGGYLGSLGNVSYFPGFHEPISGEDLLKRMRRQAELVDVNFVSDEVTAVAAGTVPFKAITDGGKEFEARSLVVATGAAARTNYLHGEREFLGRGVSYDVAADGPAVARQTVAVIGKTRQAAEEALALTRFAEHIHLIIPSSRIDADEKLLDRLHRDRSIELHFSTSLKRINGKGHVSSITVFTSGQEKEMPVAGVFTYVHEYKGTAAFLEKAVELSEGGSIKVDRNLATSTEGIYACGDVLCGRPQLPAIAAAQGLLAGMSVDMFLTSK